MRYSKSFLVLIFLFVVSLVGTSNSVAQESSANKESKKAQVLIDGKEIPALKGEGCEQYEMCCQKMGRVDSAIQLGCQLNQAAYPNENCLELLKRTRQLIVEMGKEVPAVCR